MRTADGGDVAGAADYDIVGQLSTFQVNDNNTTTDIEQITARSKRYDVTFTFNVLQSTYQADGAPPLVALKTSEVNQICGHEHVQAVRPSQDQDANGRLFNYLVVTVGTDDRARTSEVTIRMDRIGLPSAFAAIDAAWSLLTQLGPTGAIAV